RRGTARRDGRRASHGQVCRADELFVLPEADVCLEADDDIDAELTDHEEVGLTSSGHGEVGIGSSHCVHTPPMAMPFSTAQARTAASANDRAPSIMLRSRIEPWVVTTGRGPAGPATPLRTVSPDETKVAITSPAESPRPAAIASATSESSVAT